MYEDLREAVHSFTEGGAEETEPMNDTAVKKSFSMPSLKDSLKKLICTV
jgi:hypothetical protein